MAAAKKNQKDTSGREGLARRASGPLSKPVMAITVGALERALLAEFPAADAESWDRTGMTVGDSSRLVTGVACLVRAGVFGGGQSGRRRVACGRTRRVDPVVSHLTRCERARTARPSRHAGPELPSRP